MQALKLLYIDCSELAAQSMAGQKYSLHPRALVVFIVEQLDNFGHRFTCVFSSLSLFHTDYTQVAITSYYSRFYYQFLNHQSL